MSGKQILQLVSLLAVIAAGLAGYYFQDQPPPSPPPTEQSRPEPTDSRPQPTPKESPFSEEDSAEIHKTLTRIENGERKFRQDGTTFQNREGLLPEKSAGYYQEFTVVTPGLRNRGARRIVRGRDGELYYTADHYRSFVRITEQGEPLQDHDFGRTS